MMNSEDTHATTGRKTLWLVVTGILLLAFGWILTGESLEAKDSGAVKQDKGMEKLATIGDQAVTQAQLEMAATDQLEQERQKVLRDVLAKMIEDRLLEMEAKARGVSKDDLVKQEITSKVPEVTDEDVHSFYQELSKQRRELPPEERLAPQIRSHLQKQKEHAVREVFIDQLKAKAKSIGLDTAQFDQCLDNGKYPDTVKSDVKAGMIAGVSGTPAVFINGRFVNGAQPYEMFTRIIDEELAKAGKTDNG